MRSEGKGALLTVYENKQISWFCCYK
jgi:hypothetical protein